MNHEATVSLDPEVLPDLISKAKEIHAAIRQTNGYLHIAAMNQHSAADLTANILLAMQEVKDTECKLDRLYLNLQRAYAALLIGARPVAPALRRKDV